MKPITITYTGDLHCEALHADSGSTIQTDAPKDNQGLGEAFSPTDLLATSYATCVMTILALLARRLDVEMAGATARVDKQMSADSPRRVVALPLTIAIPANPSDENRRKLEQAALTCPVHHSLHPSIDKTITFQWGAAS